MLIPPVSCLWPGSASNCCVSSFSPTLMFPCLSQLTCSTSQSNHTFLHPSFFLSYWLFSPTHCTKLLERVGYMLSLHALIENLPHAYCNMTSPAAKTAFPQISNDSYLPNPLASSHSSSTSVTCDVLMHSPDKSSDCPYVYLPPFILSHIRSLNAGSSSSACS